MSFAALTDTRRRLVRIAVDMRRNNDEASLAKLLKRARKLKDDVSVVSVPDLTAVWHLRQGEILQRLKRFREAEDEARAAARALNGLRQADLLVDALVLQARCLAAVEDWPALADVTELGISVVEKHRHSLSDPYLRTGYMRARIDLYALGVRSALARGDLEAAFRCAASSRDRVRPATHEARSSAKARKLELQLRDVTDRINRAERAGRSAKSLLAKRRTLWTLYSVALRGDTTVDVPELGAVQAALCEDEAALCYFWINRTTLLRMVFDHQNVVADLFEAPGEMRDALDEISEVLTTIDSPKSLKMQAMSPLRRRKLLKQTLDRIDALEPLLWPRKPDARAILERANRLVVEPHRKLHAVPIGALKVNGEYLIQRWALRFTPDVTSLTADARRGPDGPVVVVGVAEYSVPGETLSELKEVPAECESVAAFHRAAGADTVVLIDEDATEERLAAVAGKPLSVLHLACHAMSVDAETPLESRLYLRNSALDGLEIQLFGLEPRTVVLSACNSGQRAVSARKMTELPGDDLLGLPAAFFASGATEIVGALYPLDDWSARAICEEFHRCIARGCPADIALQYAVTNFIDNDKTRSGRYYWSGLFLSALGPAQTDAGCKLAETEKGKRETS